MGNHHQKKLCRKRCCNLWELRHAEAHDHEAENEGPTQSFHASRCHVDQFLQPGKRICADQGLAGVRREATAAICNHLDSEVAEEYSTYQSYKLQSQHVPQRNGCKYMQITTILPKLWAFWIQMWYDFMSCSPLTVACTKLASSNK